MNSLYELHKATAADFTTLVEGVEDWDAPSPVKEWNTRGIVEHLVTWLPALLKQADVELPEGPDAASDPVGAWKNQTAAVDELLLDEDALARQIQMPGMTKTVAEIIAEFYEPDVFMHTWDLARASDQDFILDEARCDAMYKGMSQNEEMLRASGQFGERVDVLLSATAEDHLMGFIGRDPYWTPDN
ncbi:MAG: maleylpyruvate isomerase N-terminal domain-containing protein [Dermatophilus congolensis]|nr:maleylpyruvate isomerase N-terminal domain-containing protein [Dermatophilus congolensis]